MASLKRSAEEALDSHGDRERGASGQSAEISSCVGGTSQDEKTPKTGNAPPPKSSLENHPAHQEGQLHLTGALPKLVVLDLDKTVRTRLVAYVGNCYGDCDLVGRSRVRTPGPHDPIFTSAHSSCLFTLPSHDTRHTITMHTMHRIGTQGDDVLVTVSLLALYGTVLRAVSLNTHIRRHTNRYK